MWHAHYQIWLMYVIVHDWSSYSGLSLISVFTFCECTDEPLKVDQSSTITDVTNARGSRPTSSVESYAACQRTCYNITNKTTQSLKIQKYKHSSRPYMVSLITLHFWLTLMLKLPEKSRGARWYSCPPTWKSRGAKIPLAPVESAPMMGLTMHS